MPCLEKQDLKKLADYHVKAQKAIIGNLRTRRAKLEQEEKRILKTEGRDSPRLKQVQEAVNHLRLELDGEVESPPGSRRFTKDKEKKTAEERAEVMARQYSDRLQFVFRDTTKGGNERIASVFGLPTIEEMNKLQNKEVSDAMMTRAASLLLSRNDSRNPVDYIDTTGLIVKDPLGNTVEHHHIYNNVHLDEAGRVEFKSFRIRQDRSTGELTMDIIPAYWNAEKHGRNTQFIGLLDGMHSGNDPVTHLHYYEFSGEESEPIKEKIRADTQKIVADASNRVNRLSVQLSTLRQRRSDPQEYERSLILQVQTTETKLTAAKIAAKGLLSKPKNTLSPEQLELREAYDGHVRELKRLNKDLDEHRTLTTLRSDIEFANKTISELDERIKAIKLIDYPKGELRDAKRIERATLEDQSKSLRLENRDREKLLKDKGDIDTQIKDTERSLEEQQKLASLTEQEAISLFEKQNGFFSFDKGSAEKAEHTVYRPIMNEEITRYYVRETIDYLDREYGSNALAVLQSTARSQYKRNLLERIGALQDKVKNKVS